jgi:hypothetical protein
MQKKKNFQQQMKMIGRGARREGGGVKGAREISLAVHKTLVFPENPSLVSEHSSSFPNFPAYCT